MKMKELKKKVYLRKEAQVVFVQAKTKIRWMENPSVIIHKNNVEIGFNRNLKHFNRMQIPVFEYEVNEYEILVIRSRYKDYIYKASNKPKKEEKELILHPKDLKQILYGDYSE